MPRLGEFVIINSWTDGRVNTAYWTQARPLETEDASLTAKSSLSAGLLGSSNDNTEHLSATKCQFFLILNHFLTSLPIRATLEDALECANGLNVDFLVFFACSCRSVGIRRSHNSFWLCNAGTSERRTTTMTNNRLKSKFDLIEIQTKFPLYFAKRRPNFSVFEIRTKMQFQIWKLTRQPNPD